MCVQAGKRLKHAGPFKARIAYLGLEGAERKAAERKTSIIPQRAFEVMFRVINLPSFTRLKPYFTKTQIIPNYVRLLNHGWSLYM